MKWWGWAAFVVMLGAVLRLVLLDLRPMHTDEAVHALKFGALLESGEYRYDREEYHGPTLNYFTLPAAWIAGQRTLADLTETTLRIVPALSGIGMVLLVLSFRRAGPTAAAAAGFLLAGSPVMTYYSRYYIQETLLVFFTLGLIAAGFRFLETGRTRWAIAAGALAGLMFATKETWVISIGAMAASLLATYLIGRREMVLADSPHARRILTTGVIPAAVAGIVVSLLFFSSFFSHWDGVHDSVLAYETYFGRAGESSRHGHPWYYFFQLLTWWHEGSGPVWSEAAIVLLGVAGIAGTFIGTARFGRNRARAGGANGVTSDVLSKHRVTSDVRGNNAPVRGGSNETDLSGGLRTFLAIYSGLMFLIISALPYKTPWLVLGAYLPLILMAGWGVSGFLAWLPLRARVAGHVLLALLGAHLVWQSYLASFRYDDDPANPMVYAHPNDDVKQIAAVMEKMAGADPERFAAQVIVSGDEYWPLPWYFRRLRNIGWWNGIRGDFSPTPVILASPDREQELLRRLYEVPPPGERVLYVPLFDRPMFLRPGFEIRGYVTLDVANRFREKAG